MAFDGNGNWVSNFSAEADRDAGYKILASRFDNIFIADITSSFENCLTKDAQVRPIQAFDVNNNKIINLANPTNNNDAVNLSTLNTKDGTAVHKTGNETISGNKTFRGSNTFSGAATFSGAITSSGNNTWNGANTFNGIINVVGTNQNFKYGGTYSASPSSEQFFMYNNIQNSDGTRVFGVGSGELTNGRVYWRVESNSSLGVKVGSLALYADANSAFAVAPTPDATNSTSDEKIATTGWVNDTAKSTNVVHRTGNETIGGIKIFSKGIKDTNGGSCLTITRGSSNFTEIRTELGSGNTRTGGFRNINENGNTTLMYVTDSNGNTIKASVSVVWDGTNAYAMAPTPPSATDNSGKIATTSWVRNHRCTTAATTTSTASVDSPAYIVENYKNGANWYRVWSDGWIEQGTTTGNLGDGSSSTWTFLKAFTDTNYTVCLGAVNAGNYSTYKIKGNKTTTSVQIYQQGINGSASATVCAYACGY